MRFHRRARAVCLLLLAGCSAPNPFPKEDVERYQAIAPHPLSVHVTVEQAPLFSQAPAVLPLPALIDPVNREEIERAIVASLEQYNVFTSITYGAQPADEADVELRVTLQQDPATGIGEKETNNFIWANLGLWLFAGAPAWILDDVSYHPEVRARYVLNRLPSRGVDEPNVLISKRRVDFSDDLELNFLRRAGTLQYLMQVLVPPFLLPADREKVDQSLYENFVSRLQREIGTTAKQDLVDSQLRMSRNVPYLHELPIEGGRLFVLMSNEFIEAGELIWKGPQGVVRRSAVEWQDPFAAPAVLSRIQEDDVLATLLEGKAHSYVRHFKTTDVQAPGEDGVYRLIVRLEGIADPWTWTLRERSGSLEGLTGLALR